MLLCRGSVLLCPGSVLLSPGSALLCRGSALLCRGLALAAALCWWFSDIVVTFLHHGRSIAVDRRETAGVTEEEIAMTETMTAPAPRLKNPAMLVPGAMEAIVKLAAITRKANLPATTFHLVHLRVSQINGCSACVEGGWREARKAGETDERLFAVSAWRESPRFTVAERAALALAEAATRLADRADAVPDEIWDETARHYDEEGLAALVLAIGVTNLFNRLNATTRQTAGSWG